MASWSGASMASQQVSNPAAKLFALHPAMTAVEVKADILAHAAPITLGGPPLLDPKATLAGATWTIVCKSARKKSPSWSLSRARRRSTMVERAASSTG